MQDGLHVINGDIHMDSVTILVMATREMLANAHSLHDY